MLRYVRHAVSPPRSHEALMELRDISSMAMEHFEEKILPVLREVNQLFLLSLRIGKSCLLASGHLENGCKGTAMA